MQACNLLDQTLGLSRAGVKLKTEEANVKIQAPNETLKMLPPVFPALLRKVPTIVTAHTFCASRDTRVSCGWCPVTQEYFCAV